MSALLKEPIQAADEQLAAATVEDHRALRFLTAGSVDDGKSTLIGRLLYDSRAILADQLDMLERKAGGEAIDLSLLTDGLEAEREQGITIDVAYRYFATPRRKFIIADAPGHEQYTRNMVTAAAGSDAAIVLVDITKIDWAADTVALLPQTRRHALLAHLLRVPNIVFAVNKIDALAQPQQAFEAVRAALQAFARRSRHRGGGHRAGVGAARRQHHAAAAHRLVPGPVAAATAGERCPPRRSASTARCCCRCSTWRASRASRPTAPATSRARCGAASPTAACVPASEVELFPSGQRATVVALRRAGSAVDAAEAGQSVGLILDRQLDVSRGDWIGTPQTLLPAQRFGATLAWLDTEPAVIGRKYMVRHGNRWVQARIASIGHRLDIGTLEPTDAHELSVNDIGHVVVELQQPLPLEPYAHNRVAGSLIVVDPASNRTSGALLVNVVR